MGARPSRIGEWVRALGLADLPLLANVARGDLSLADALECLAGDG
jgi:lipopolysaccharide/colanic/teichoic acid biosynthesis glycosyltransferase